MLKQSLDKLWELIARSKSIVALTGAGVSTESGIPDFRSPGGLWEKYDPMEAFSSEGFLKKPEILYTVGRSLTQGILKAEPNKTHFFLKKLEDSGKLKTIVTQNVDGLHQRAGSADVIEVHGNLNKGRCLSCGRIYSVLELEEQMEKGFMPPRCVSCNGLIKPNVILFGDPMPYSFFTKAISAAESADLMLAIGTSLLVSPASDLPQYCVQNGGKLAILNLQSTWLDHSAVIVINEMLDIIMKDLIGRFQTE